MTPLEPNLPLCRYCSGHCQVGYGLCHCGCGEPTTPAPFSCSKWNSVKGQPQKFIRGHHGRIRPAIVKAKPFRLYGVYCRIIPLTRGLYAIVNIEKYVEYMQFKWCATTSPNLNGYYACRAVKKHGKKMTIYMHREVLGLKPEDSERVDHRDPMRTTENCIQNLRLATPQQNSANCRRMSRNTSGRKGVSLHKATGKWRPRLSIKGKEVYLPVCKSFEEACAVREAAEKKYHGEFARKE